MPNKHPNQPALFNEERRLTEGSRNEPLTMQVSEGLQVEILPSTEHVYLMTSREVAHAYGIAVMTVGQHRRNHTDELNEHIHFVKGLQILNTLGNNAQPDQIFWTKAGVVRLGMFIRSDRAKLFRDWAEKVILERLAAPAPVGVLPAAPRRKHNRLTPDRMVRLMALVCRIEDKGLRLQIAAEISGEGGQDA